MSSSFPNRPRILKGAFVEYQKDITQITNPPIIFQFNPTQLTRNRGITFSTYENKPYSSLPEFHQQQPDLSKIQEEQKITVQEESINFEILLDATDQMNAGDITAQFGIEPQLAALELMLHAPEEIKPIRNKGYSYTKKPNPPIILFIWGLTRVLPVNIESLNITETEFNPTLFPTRATVSLSIKVIEGVNALYKVHLRKMAGWRLMNQVNQIETVLEMIPR
jgi:hypothetical protein